MDFSLEQFTFGRNLDPAVLSVLSKLRAKYGANLVFLSRDTEWINFEVHGLTDEVLLRDVEREQQHFFDDLSSFQILRGLERSERGIFLRHLSGPLRNPKESGFWYY